MKVPKKNDYLARQKARDRVPQDATQRTISLRLSSGMTGCRRSSMEKSQKAYRDRKNLIVNQTAI